jgi:FMN-dependent NADH-azoreductase
MLFYRTNKSLNASIEREHSMKTLLQISSSIRSGDGESSRLAQQFIDQWSRQNPASQRILRDLARDPVPHLDAARFDAFLSKPGERTRDQQAVVDYSDELISELKRADVIVLGLPMYNFGVPSTLKAYFDHIARAGATFGYTESGPVGLLTGKKAYVFATRGGLYRGTPLDTESAYVRDFFRFIGITDVEFVYAEGLAMSAVREESLQHARAEIDRLDHGEQLAA